MNILALLDTLQTIARNGLLYATNPFDRERYDRLLQAASQNYSEYLQMPEEAVRQRLSTELGYITPKVGTDAAIFNEAGEILLMDRADGSGWCLPCGFVEPNESPAEGILREVREETGLEVQIVCLVGVFTRKPGPQTGLHTTISIVHLCEVTGGTQCLSHEGRELKYWPIDEVPRWHFTHETPARAAYAMWRSTELISAISV